MTAEKINGNGGQATTTYPPGMSRRRSTEPKLTPEQRQAARKAAIEAEARAAAKRTLATAPPPSEAQLALLARLCAANPIAPVEQTRRSA